MEYLIRLKIPDEHADDPSAIATWVAGALLRSCPVDVTVYTSATDLLADTGPDAAYDALAGYWPKRIVERIPFALLDMYGDGSSLYLVENHPHLNGWLEEWRQLDYNYVAGELPDSEYISLPDYLYQRGVRFFGLEGKML